MNYVQARKQMKKQAHQTIKKDYGHMFLIYLPLIFLGILEGIFRHHELLAILLWVIALILDAGAMSASEHVITHHLVNVPYIKMDTADFHKKGALKEYAMIIVRTYLFMIVGLILVMMSNIIFKFLGILLLLFGIMKVLALSQAPYIYSELLSKGKTESVGHVLDASNNLMKGHMMQLFKLRVSLCGWYILANLPFTLGLFNLYTAPYLNLVNVQYYLYLRRNHGSNLSTGNSIQQPKQMSGAKHSKSKKLGFFSSMKSYLGQPPKQKQSRQNAKPQNQLNGGIHNNSNQSLNSFSNNNNSWVQKVNQINQKSFSNNAMNNQHQRTINANVQQPQSQNMNANNINNQSSMSNSNSQQSNNNGNNIGGFKLG